MQYLNETDVITFAKILYTCGKQKNGVKWISMRFMKRLISIILTFIMLISTFLPLVADASNITATNMALSNAPVAFEKESNNTIVTANTIQLNTQVGGNLSFNGDEDWYKFTIPSDGMVQISFDNEYIKDKSWRANLYNAENKQISSDTFPGTEIVTQSSSEYGLKAGTYYVCIDHDWSRQSNLDYGFSVNFTQSDFWEKELNDTIVTANPIECGKFYYGTIMDYSLGGADEDWYSFTISDGMSIQLTFGHDFIDDGCCWWTYIYSNDNNQIYHKGWNGKDIIDIDSDTIDLESGTYYIRITANDLHFEDKITYWLAVSKAGESATKGDGEETPTESYDTIPVKFDDKITVDLLWNDELFNKNASEYDHNLAMASLYLSRGTYDGESNMEYRMDSLGFGDIVHSGYDAGDWEPADPAITLGMKKININGETKYLIALVVRGSSRGGDWIFTNVGSMVDGFAFAGINIINKINNYKAYIQEEYNCYLEADDLVYFLCGHSLGGAVAGIVSNDLLKKTEAENIFVYTFASPNYWTVEDCELHKNVHNIIALGDFVPTVPWLKKRYGNDWYYDLEKCKNQINRVYGKEPVWDIGFYHASETYLACLLSGVPDNMGDGAQSIYNLSSIHCPVDITVLDEKGIEMGHTNGEEVTLSDESRVIIYTDGDEKYVISPTNEKFTIKFTATDKGTMIFSQSKIETFSRSTIDEKEFANVDLTKGKIMIAEIGGDIDTNAIRLFVQNKKGRSTSEIMTDGSEKSILNNLWLYIVMVICVVAVLTVAVIAVWSVKKHKNEIKNNIGE